MRLPEFDYATIEFINTWQYSEGPNGSMAIARLHSKSAPDVLVALFSDGPRHQNTFENLFTTKAKFGFTVEDQEVTDDKTKGFLPADLHVDDRCDAPLAGAFTARAIFYPICK